MVSALVCEAVTSAPAVTVEVSTRPLIGARMRVRARSNRAEAVEARAERNSASAWASAASAACASCREPASAVSSCC